MANTQPIKDLIRRTLWATGDDRFVYFWFRKPSELEEPTRKKRRGAS